MGQATGSCKICLCDKYTKASAPELPSELDAEKDPAVTSKIEPNG